MADNQMDQLMDVEGHGGLVAEGDVTGDREHARLSRLSKLLFVLVPLFGYLWWRVITRDPLALPRMTPRVVEFLPIVLLIVMLGAAMVVPLLGAGRSPHVLYRPDEIDASFDDVKGAPVVVEEVVKTLNLFLAHRTFREQMGGTPRRAILFEGPPGTGQDLPGQGHGRRGGRAVPLRVLVGVPVACSTGRPTARSAPTSRRCARHARREGGAIGFIEEIDAIGAARARHGSGGGHARASRAWSTSC